MKHVKITADPLSRGTIEVDGKDLSNAVTGIEFVGHVGNLTSVVLHLKASSLEATFDGEVVYVRSPSPREAIEQAIAAVQDLDPKMVEEAALEKLQWGGPSNISQATLATILEMLRGASDQSAADQEVRGSADDG